MPSSIYQRFSRPQQYNNGSTSLAQDMKQVERDPGSILEILYRKGKINQQVYNELQPYRNNPEYIGKYLLGNQFRP